MAQKESSITADSDASARILAEILRRLEEAGGPITLSATKLAATMGIPIAAFRLKINGLFAEGRLVKLSSGLAGTRIAAPGMSDATPTPEAPKPAGNAAPADTTDPDTTSECESEEDAPASDAPDVPPAEAPISATPQSLRASIHAHLKDAIAAAGGEATITMAHLATAVGTHVNTATHHVKALVDLGHIATTSKGRYGTAVRLGSGAPGPKKLTAPSKAASSGTRAFCPWCGTKVSQPDWKFCHSCGEKLA